MAPPGRAPNTPSTGPQPTAIQSAPNLVAFDPKQVVPAQSLYVQRNDIIGFNFLASMGNAQVRVNYRWLTPEGEIKEGQLDTGPFIFTGLFTIQIYEGWLLSFTARVTSNPFAGFFCFMQAVVFRPPIIGPTGNFESLIWQGYLSAAAPNGWPGTPSKEITDGPGFLRSITGFAPGVGAECNDQVPAGRRWILLRLRATLTTSAAAANRNVSFVISTPTGAVYKSNSYFNQTAITSISYSAAANSPPAGQLAGDQIILFPLPAPLRTAYTIQSFTVGIQAGDQWSGFIYDILEWGQWDQ